MPELRKRKALGETAPPPPPTKKKNSTTKTGASNESPDKKEKGGVANGAGSASGPASAATVGSIIDLDGFGGEVETNDGAKTSMKQLVEESKNGVILFTYPKASTPGCTTQVCLFRDSYTPLTGTGFSVYGLSRDSPKANTTFKTKQSLPYTLLCDTKGDLIQAIGLKKAPSGTSRGVFIVSKEGKVLAAEAGGPAKTLEIALESTGGEDKEVQMGDAPTTSKEEKEVEEEGKAPAEVKETPPQATAEETPEQEMENVERAEVAADVADTAEKLDGSAA